MRWSFVVLLLLLAPMGKGQEPTPPTPDITDASCAEQPGAPQGFRACARQPTKACGCGQVQEVAVSPGHFCCLPKDNAECMDEAVSDETPCTLGSCQWSQWTE